MPKRRMYRLIPTKPLVPSIDTTTIQEPGRIVRSTSPPFQSTSYVEEKVGKWWYDTGSYPGLRNYDGVSWVGTLKVWVLEVGDYLQVGAGTVDVDLTGIYMDRSKFQAQNAGTDQVWIDITDGKFYAGAGAVTLDADGIRIADGSNPVNEIKWGTGGGLANIFGASGTPATLFIRCGRSGSTSGEVDIRAYSGAGNYVGVLLNHTTDGAGYFQVPTRLTLGTPTELTISGGVITVTQSYHEVDTQNDDATDDLDTINGGTNAMLLCLTAENAARTVVVKDGTGNIALDGGVDFSLDTRKDRIILQYDSRIPAWVEWSRSSN